MNIDRCYCFRRTFDELKDVAEANDARSVAELQEYISFGHNCQLCHPYVRRMLRTGQVEFHEVIEAKDEPAP